MIKYVAVAVLGLFGAVQAVEVKGNVCQIDEVEYPIVGFGTYPLVGDECSDSVELAAKAGCRIIDTATFYDNFEPIGKTVRKLGRDQFYIISKVWYDKQTPAKLMNDLNQTLERLQTDHIDGYLIHWPNSSVPIEQTMKTMDELRAQKKIRHIGLSNVTVNHLKRVLETGVPITWVQVEMSPLFFDPELIEFCQKNGMAVQAWSPLGRGSSSKDADLAKMGKKYGKSGSQVALRWVIQHGCIPLPSSSHEGHIAENMNVFDFSLSDEEMGAIDKKAKGGQRLRVTPEFYLGFTDEFDFTYEQCWPKKKASGNKNSASR